MTVLSWDMISFEQGTVALVACGDLLHRVCFERSQGEVAAALHRLHPTAVRVSQPYIQTGLHQLTEYFHGARRFFTLQVNNGLLTDFARNVQQELLKVPYGAVVTYGELASRVGSPKAARAVGRVMAMNPYPLLVPCHRVVNADGSIGQYSAAHGVASKAWLINFERALAAEYPVKESAGLKNTVDALCTRFK